jgi:hypothetical protein
MARARLVDEYDGEVEGWSRCEHAGYACRKLRYVTGDGRHGLARLYLHEDVVMIVNAAWRGNDDGHARRFLASAS